MVVFNVFKLYKWYQIAQRITKAYKKRSTSQKFHCIIVTNLGAKPEKVTEGIKRKKIC